MAKISSTKGNLLGLKILVAFSLFLAVSHAATCSADDGVCDNNYSVDPMNQECQLYLAVSSIPNAGIGVYTSVDYKKGDFIGEGEMMIPITEASDSDEWMIGNVQWSVDIDARLYYEADESNIAIYVPGFGAQINCHMGLNNVEHTKPKFDSASLHRSKDPGVGAFTNWYDIPNVATRDILSGEELFVDYGEGWFTSRASSMGDIPMEGDFARADRIVKRMKTIIQNFPSSQDTHSIDSDESSIFADFWDVVRNASSQALERALPRRHEDLDDAIKHGTARHSMGGPSSIRSKEWLHQNGMCIDNMYVSISTIPQAGRGAFAKWFLPKDSIVSPAPVLQVHKKLLNNNEKHGFHLLYNYAFGHPDSPIILFPYSSTVNFINHDSQNPNVKLRWATTPLHSKEFLDMSSDDVLKQGFGLVMEFVALRDIQPNEEIVYDYGVEWERAWQKHMEEWKPILGSEIYTSANDALHPIGVLTVEEQKTRPYPDNIRTACIFYGIEGTTYTNITDNVDLVPTFRVEWAKKNHDCLRWCSILDRYNVSGHVFYDTLLLPQETNLHEDCMMSKDEMVFVNLMPSEAVTLVDLEQSRDQYLPNAFRHYIQLSDDLYPTGWRLRKTPSSSHDVTENNSDQCRLFLAKSSIPNAGIGIYTTGNYKKGDSIGEEEMLLPITDLQFEDWWLVTDVQWNAGLSSHLYYESNETNSIFYPGFGAQINCHFGLNNVDHTKPKFDSAGLHRSKDPGVGAFTNWHGMSNIATRDIEAGEELFTTYGYGWFDYRKNLMGDIPREDDFARADRIVQKVYEIGGKHNKKKDFKTEQRRSALKDFWGMLHNVSSQALDRALPQRYDDINEEVIKSGTARHSVGGQSSIRSQEWLNENGMCLDNIYVNTSTIAQAGRGAFAQRFLPQDSVVSPAPVLQVPSSFLFYKPIGFQLLYNYAFGHPDSPVFLLPYSTTVNFINHDRQHSNVMLRWSSSPFHRKDFLDMSSDAVLKQSFGLIMEFVALRDIQPNEEILLDYGAEWELAWQKHAEMWVPAPGSENYTSAVDAVKTFGILTVEEQKLNPYPDNVHTACFFSDTEGTSYENITTNDGDPRESYKVQWNKMNDDCLRLCSILGKSISGTNGNALYSALLLPQKSNLDEDCIMPKDEKIYVHDIPSEAVTLVDHKFSRDQHIPNAFRSYIRLSDDLYPASWKPNRTQ